jgi:hypothetical protein
MKRDLLGDAVMLLWDVYNDDKTGRRAEQILAFMEDADHEAWAEEIDAAYEYAETDRSQQGPI